MGDPRSVFFISECLPIFTRACEQSIGVLTWLDARGVAGRVCRLPWLYVAICHNNGALRLWVAPCQWRSRV